MQLAPASFFPFNSERHMTKSSTTPYTLARGRNQPYRKTITYLSEQPLIGSDGKQVVGPDGKPVLKMLPDPKRPAVQMVFEADEDIELTEEELGHLENAIKSGVIVPTNRDGKGRQRSTRVAPSPEAADEIAKLEKKVEEVSAKNAELKSENDKLKADLQAAKSKK